MITTEQGLGINRKTISCDKCAKPASWDDWGEVNIKIHDCTGLKEELTEDTGHFCKECLKTIMEYLNVHPDCCRCNAGKPIS